MLRSFRLGNHRSFRDEHELSVIPAYDRDRPALPVIAIYGANASGKSNLLDGLRFMTNAVRNSFRSWHAGEGVPRSPFRLDPVESSRPSTFVVELVLDDVRHTYGFTVDGERVLEEWLYSYPAKKKRVLFEREGSDIKLGTTMSDSKGRLEVIEELILQNTLFLSLAGQLVIESLQPVYRWFSDETCFRSSHMRMPTEVITLRMRRLFLDESEYATLAGLLSAADVGITGIWLRDRESRQGPVFEHGEGASFEIEDESDGTRSWLELLLDATKVLSNGGVLVVDEIDASLHPLLTARLVDLFRSDESNPRGAQLIFSTHDASLLGTMLGEEVLGRDQVWFVEKDKGGASNLYPLTDFKPRQGENTERRYLGGSYGAVPVLDRDDFLKAMRGQ